MLLLLLLLLFPAWTSETTRRELEQGYFREQQIILLIFFVFVGDHPLSRWSDQEIFLGVWCLVSLWVGQSLAPDPAHSPWLWLFLLCTTVQHGTAAGQEMVGGLYNCQSSRAASRTDFTSVTARCGQEQMQPATGQSHAIENLYKSWTSYLNLATVWDLDTCGCVAQAGYKIMDCSESNITVEMKSIDFYLLSCRTICLIRIIPNNSFHNRFL